MIKGKTLDEWEARYATSQADWLTKPKSVVGSAIMDRNGIILMLIEELRDLRAADRKDTPCP